MHEIFLFHFQKQGNNFLHPSLNVFDYISKEYLTFGVNWPSVAAFAVRQQSWLLSVWPCAQRQQCLEDWLSVPLQSSVRTTVCILGPPGTARSSHCAISGECCRISSGFICIFLIPSDSELLKSLSWSFGYLHFVKSLDHFPVVCHFLTEFFIKSG